MKFPLVRSSSLSVARFSGSLPSGLGRALLLAIVCLALSSYGTAVAQLRAVGQISTVAGIANATHATLGDGGPATLATLSGPKYISFDNAGNLYIPDSNNNRIRKIAASTGIITTVAGSATFGETADGDGGPATSAVLYSPSSVIVDASGNLYIAESYNNQPSGQNVGRIRKVNAATGIISTLAGGHNVGFSGDGGPATSAMLYAPFQLLLDGKGNLLFADSGNGRIRKIVLSTGIITTIAGNGAVNSATGQLISSGDGGSATSASLGAPSGLAIDSLGNLYLGDSNAYSVRRISASTGIITTYAGNGTTPSSGDGGPATSAGFTPGQIAFDRSGTLFIADFLPANSRVRAVNPGTGIISTVAGNGMLGSSGDGGAAVSASMNQTLGVAFDPSGNLLIADYGNNEIRKVVPSTVFAATGVGQSAAVQNVYLQTTAVEAISSLTVPKGFGGAQEYTVGTVTGCLVNGETTNPAGTVCTVPVTFKPAYPGYRPLPLQAVTGTTNVNVGLNGLGTGPLAAFTPGIIHNYAGTENSPQGNSGNGGPATSAVLNYPTFVTTDGSGNLYFNDFQNCVIQKVTAATGILTVVAGSTCNFATYAPAGDGGPATSATLGAPKGIVLDSARNLYIADQFYIRKVDAATGIITSIAGTGTNGYSGDGGPATAANLDQTNGIGIDSLGNLYLDSSVNSVIRKIAASSGIISTVVGNGTQGYSGNGGPATAAQLNSPLAVTADNSGNLFILDSGNGVVREVNALTGAISTVAGNGKQGTSGDGGPATSASLTLPTDIAVDAAGDLYIVTGGLVRKVSAASGTIVTVAGSTRNGNVPYSGDGGPAGLATNNPNNVAIDAAGNLYMSSSGDNGITVVPAAPSQLSYPTTTSVGFADSADDPQTATLSDIGNTSLTISSPTTGQNPAVTPSWSLDRASTCPQLSTLSMPATLAVGADCTFATDFLPTMSGALTGTLVVTDNSLNAPLSTQTVNLSGTASGVATASATLTPTSADFGSIASGMNLTVTRSFTFTNTGTLALSSSATISGTGSAEYSVTGNTCPQPLAAGASCTITVTFTAPVPGTYMATLSVQSNTSSGTIISLSSSLTGVGLAQATETLTPASANFGTLAAGATSAAQTFTLSNTGNVTFDNSYSIVGPGASSYTISAINCPLVDPGSLVCTIQVTFSPQSAGIQTAMLSVFSTYGASSMTQTSALTGVGTAAPAPQATLTPASASFGSQTVGTQSTSQTFTLTNAGNAALPITSVTTGSSSFPIGASNCGSSLPAGASCQISVSFTPGATGTASATLTVTDSLGSQSSSLTGTGTAVPAPQASLTPASASFGTLTVGTQSPSQTFTLSNGGNATLPITSVAVAGSSAFVIAGNTCSTSLGIGASCQILINFTPTSAVSYSASLMVVDSVGTQSSSLSGSGTAPAAPQASLSPAAAAFGSVTVGGKSAAQTFTLTNAGNATLSIASVSLMGANAAAFAVTTNTCAASLAAGATCQVSIAFTPSTLGAATATLTIVDAVGTQTSALTGSGTTLPDFTLGATPAAQFSYLGATVTYVIQLSSMAASNAFTQPVTLSVTGLPAGATASFSPATVIPGSAGTSSTLTVNTPPTLLQATLPATPGSAVGLSFAGLLACSLVWLRKRKLPRLLALCVFAALSSMILSAMGCGSGAGFAIPTSTSTLIVTGTGGVTSHTTSVTLTLK